MDIKLQRLRELTRILVEASEAYYTKDSEIMTNQEFDKLHDELVALERELGFHLPESPTHRVGSEPSSKLPKERHKMPMQSLAKTKNLEECTTAFSLGNWTALLWFLHIKTVSFKKR